MRLRIAVGLIILLIVGCGGEIVQPTIVPTADNMPAEQDVAMAIVAPTKTAVSTNTPSPTATNESTATPIPTPDPLALCKPVNDISESDCVGLLALYDKAGIRQKELNWFTTEDACEWEGIGCKDNQITALTLSGYDLEGVLPLELSQLKQLTELDLSNNNLTGTIPVSIGELIELQTLRLYLNQLSGEIPPELGNLTNLDILLLGENQLTGSIPNELGNLQNIVSLDFRENQLIGDIPLWFGDLPLLNHLNLMGTQIQGPASKGLLLSQVQYVSLSELNCLLREQQYIDWWEKVGQHSITYCDLMP